MAETFSLSEPTIDPQTIWGTISPCLRIWPILCTQFIMMARVVVGSGASDVLTFCVVEFSYFGLSNVLCTEGLRSSVVYLGDFPW